MLCEHLTCVPHIRDVLDLDASFYKENDLDTCGNAFLEGFKRPETSLSPLTHLCSEFKSMDFELLPNKNFDSFDRALSEEISDSQMSDSWDTASQVLRKAYLTSGNTVIGTPSQVISAEITVSSKQFDDTLPTDKSLKTKREIRDPQTQRLRTADTANLPNPVVVIQDTGNRPDEITEHPRHCRPMTINGQNFYKLLERSSKERPPVMPKETQAFLVETDSSERAGLTFSNVPENRTKGSDTSGHGNSEDEISQSMKQEPPVQHLSLTPDNNDQVLVCSERVVPASRDYRDRECEKHSLSGSHALEICAECIEPEGSKSCEGKDDALGQDFEDPSVTKETGLVTTPFCLRYSQQILNYENCGTVVHDSYEKCLYMLDSMGH